MSTIAQPRSGPIMAIGSVVVLVGMFVASVMVVQQALVARTPSGYQVPIVNVARQIGLAPPQPTFGEPQPRFAGSGAQLDIAAQTIGISMDQLRAELATRSLAQVAQVHGVDPNSVAVAMKSASHSPIDAAVANGRLTADQATQRKLQADQRIDQLMYAEFSGRRYP
jgi:hypothetical protein